MSLFKKKGPKPAFKPRLSEVAAEDTIKTAGDEDSAGAESPSAIATKLKKQAKKAKAKTPLSFGAEEQVCFSYTAKFTIFMVLTGR